MSCRETRWTSQAVRLGSTAAPQGSHPNQFTFSIWFFRTSSEMVPHKMTWDKTFTQSLWPKHFFRVSEYFSIKLPPRGHTGQKAGAMKVPHLSGLARTRSGYDWSPTQCPFVHFSLFLLHKPRASGNPPAPDRGGFRNEHNPFQSHKVWPEVCR